MTPEQQAAAALGKETWTQETMRAINDMTAEIKGKAFNPDWFLLRQRFEAIEYALAEKDAEIAELRGDLACAQCYGPLDGSKQCMAGHRGHSLVRHNAKDARIAELEQAVSELVTRAEFGDQCYQDRCENAYVEQTVMKRALRETRPVNVRIGTSVLTRDLVWCDCGRGLSMLGKWLFCPSCGGGINQDSYAEACESARANGANIYRLVEDVEKDLNALTNARTDLIEIRKMTLFTTPIYRAISEAIEKLDEALK